MRIALLRLLLLLAVLPLAKTVHAAESYDNCTGFIASLPAVISTPGTWCLNQDLATSMTTGNAIEIQANNVTVDCNDFKLDGLGAGTATQTSGIAAYDRLNATVRNCAVRGFLYGVFFKNNTGTGGAHTVEDNQFDFNTFSGILVQGDGSSVRHNSVLDTGGSTITPAAQAIVTYYAVDVLDNTVSGVTARSGGGGSATGINTFSNAGGNVSDNRIRGLLRDGAGQTRGIYNASSDRLILRNNNVVAYPASPSFGLACPGAPNDGARDNVISGFITAIYVCKDSGGNSITP